MVLSEFVWQWYDYAVVATIFLVATEIIYLKLIELDIRWQIESPERLASGKVIAMMLGTLVTLAGGLLYELMRRLESHEQWMIGAAVVGVALMIGFFKVNYIIGLNYMKQLQEKRNKKPKR